MLLCPIPSSAVTHSGFLPAYGQVYHVELSTGDNRWTTVVSTHLGDLFSSDIVRGHAFTEEERQSAKAIVYVPTRRLAEYLSERLEDGVAMLEDDSALHGIKFVHVHGGLEDEERCERLTQWRAPRVKAVLVATDCCAAGLDVPTVRGVFVCGVQNTLINVFQSFGRAGRDGKPALACLLVDEGGAATALAVEEVDYPLPSNSTNLNEPYAKVAAEQGQHDLIKYGECVNSCHRQRLHTLMDGRSDNCLAMAATEGFELCGFCFDAFEKASLHHAPSAPLGHTTPRPSLLATSPSAGTTFLSMLLMPIDASADMWFIPA